MFALLPLRASAQSGASPAEPVPSEAELGARAEALITAGVEQRATGDEQRAFESFRAAYALVPSARARGQMGLAAKSVRSFVEAEQYLNEALARATEPWVVTNRDLLEDALALVQSNLAWLDVHTEPARAALVVNGKTEALPLARPLRVVAGVVRIELSAEGYEPYLLEQTLPARQATTLRVALKPRAAAASAALAVPQAEPAPRQPRAASSAKLLRTAGYASGALGVVSLAASGYFATRALAYKSQRNSVCPTATCPTGHGVELDRDARRAALYSTLGFGVGALALGASAVLLLSARAEPVSAANKKIGGVHVQVALGFFGETRVGVSVGF